MLHETRSINTVIAVIPLLVVLSACGERSLDREAKVQEAAVRANYAKAKALFEQRCKTAGVVIKRTVKDVEGIEILKVRPVLAWGDKRYFDPMFDGAAMAAEAQGDGYIASFLYSELRNPNTPERRGVVQPPTSKPGMNQDAPRQGYRYVDVRDPATSTVLRYRIALHLTEAQWYQRGGWAKDLEHTVRTGPQARFAVDYEDIVDPVDRAYWIAGTRIKVIDRQNGEAIAQLTRYVWDQGVGGSSTGRWPWQHASAQGNECPTSQSTHYTTRFFIDTVLIPKQGD